MHRRSQLACACCVCVCVCVRVAGGFAWAGGSPAQPLPGSPTASAHPIFILKIWDCPHCAQPPAWWSGKGLLSYQSSKQTRHLTYLDFQECYLAIGIRRYRWGALFQSVRVGVLILRRRSLRANTRINTIGYQRVRDVSGVLLTRRWRTLATISRTVSSMSHESTDSDVTPSPRPRYAAAGALVSLPVYSKTKRYPWR